MKNNVRFFGVSLMMTFVTVPKRRRRRGKIRSKGTWILDKGQMEGEGGRRKRGKKNMRNEHDRGRLRRKVR